MPKLITRDRTWGDHKMMRAAESLSCRNGFHCQAVTLGVDESEVYIGIDSELWRLPPALMGLNVLRRRPTSWLRGQFGCDKCSSGIFFCPAAVSKDFSRGLQQATLAWMSSKAHRGKGNSVKLGLACRSADRSLKVLKELFVKYR